MGAQAPGGGKPGAMAARLSLVNTRQRCHDDAAATGFKRNLHAAHRSNASNNKCHSAGGRAKVEQQAGGLAKPALPDDGGKKYNYGKSAAVELVRMASHELRAHATTSLQ